MQRRKFIRTAGVITLGLSMAEKATLAAGVGQAAARHPPNVLPRWKGFNLLDFYSPN
jgi:endoglucanase